MKIGFFYPTLRGKILLKFIIMLKLTWILTIVFAMQIKADNLYSQVTKIDLKGSNMSLEEIIWEIKNKTEFDFFYSTDDIKEVKDLTIFLKNATINEILAEVLSETNLEYKVINKTIIIKKSVLNDPIKPELKALFQQLTIKGKVTDSQGTPLPGVNVVEKGTTNGAITNVDGQYTISVSSPNAILSFSYVGFLTEDITVAEQTVIDVTLIEDITSLEEVVVIGYGTVKKSDLTGSVSSVSSKDLKDRIVTDLSSLIQGKVAGVDITRNTIRIRGVTTFNNTDPLVIVDGFQGGSLSGIGPNNIESIEILKDASSTAIYGAKGANGVILVTTKNGKAGPLKVDVNVLGGVSSTPKKLDLLNASQYIDYVQEALTNANMTITDKLQSDEVRQDVTDWQDEVFRTGTFNEYNVNLSGGSDKSTFFIGLYYRHDKQFYINESHDAGKVMIKNQFNLKKWLKAGDNISLSYSIANGSKPSWWPQFTTALPYMPVLDKNNYWGYAVVDRANDLSDAINPVSETYLSHPETNTVNYQANAWAEVEPIKGLVYHFQAGVTGTNQRYTLWNDQYDNALGNTVLSNYTEESSYSIYPLIESYLTYSNKIKKHDFSVMIGNTWQDYARYGGIGIYGEGFDGALVRNILLADTQSILNHESNQYAYLSYFGRINYQYNNRYLLTANIRRDSSPRFSPTYRWGTFPSMALAWKISEEPWMKNLELFDLLKLRASWGISGNDAIGDFRYLSQVWSEGVYYPLGEPAAEVSGATVNENASQGIKWESTTSKTLGIDVGMLNNSLSVTAEYFIKNTDDILFDVPRALSLGYGTMWDTGDAVVNAASCENKGFELQVGYKNRIGLLNYSINANYTNVHNVVTSLGLGQPYGTNSRTEIGFPIAYLYGYVADGVFMTQSELDEANQSAKDIAKAADPTLTDSDLSSIYYQYSTTSAGDVRFRDINNDGRVTDDDRTMIGNSIPKHLYGFNLNLQYKEFDFSAYFQGIAGSDVNYYFYTSLRGMSTPVNKESYVLDRWHSESDPGNGIVPRAVMGDPAENNRFSSLQVYSGDYLKLKQLSIGYTFQDNIISKIGLSELRVYASGYNLLTFTKYPGYDPEFVSSNLGRGTDVSNFPSPRMVSLGIQVGL